MKTIEEIKAECREVIALNEKAGKGPWRFVDSEDCDPECREECWAIETPDGMLDGDNLKADVEMIVAARNASPGMAKALLDLINLAEFIRDCGSFEDSNRAKRHLGAIGKNWP